jgi:diguanylate cyclase (GGDEF)-like protein/PAS domain S-box-containing protein
MSFEQQTNAGIVVADATQRGCPMIYVSPGFVRLTGYTLADVMGRSCSLLQGPATDPEAIALLRNAITQEREANTTLVNYRKDGSQFWNEVSIAPEYDDAGRLVRYLGVQRDVTELIDARERMRELAYSDPLTGLGNRAALTTELDRALIDAQTHAHQLALLFIDLDDFKTINDSHGHAAGDRLLAAVADRLRAETRPTDLLARPGGDEFLLLIRGETDILPIATRLAARIGESLNEPIVLPNGRPARVRASVGVSLYPQDAQTAEDLLKHSDRAMYVAKGAGKNRFHLYHGVSRKTGYQPDADFDPSVGFEELDHIIRERAITPVFQPIIAIDDGEIVGYEALARGPGGSILERPDRLFTVAAACDRVTELDWLCRIRAVEEALRAGLGRSAALFINCEPSVIDAPCPAADQPIWERAGRELELVLEITERAITGRPAELSRLVRQHRMAGRGIALDDVGADTRSLALLPFIEPDVIKLDLRLVQDRPSAEQAAIVAAVAAESERTGAAVVAEGIETDAHLMVARALGAGLGQGYLWGKPGPLPDRPSSTWRRPIVSHGERVGRTPFEIVAAQLPVAEATKALLLPMSHLLEDRALNVGEGAVLLSAFQDAEHFTPKTAVRYRALARNGSLIAAFGVGLGSEPVPGVRGAGIEPGDPLRGEWSVLVVGPHFAGALVAQDLGDDCRESDRRFMYATTYRRDLVVAAARSLIERIAPLSEETLRESSAVEV